MRVCPACQSRFVGGETFCPHDGTKLVDARELSPGELTGSKLEGVVRLDKLVYADAFAERYTGRLLESRRAVYVTVFNQEFRVGPSATKRVETARAKVGSPMPVQINTLLQTHFDKEVPFLVESEPRGPSVRTLLDEKRALAWDEAVRITANLARAMQWLHEQGVPHCSFHPTSVFVTKLSAGQVVVGDWAMEALFPPDSAERLLEEDPNAFAGYVDYMAPEIARATEKADIRSAVYALGCVLYEMVLGKVPLPGKSPAEVLKRHQHEKPVRLSIAVGGGDLPAQLDDILEMMLAKDPDKRFHSPAAAVAALSNLVADAPDALAPPLHRAAETDIDDLYRTIDMDSVDREAIEQMTAGPDDHTVRVSSEDQQKLGELATGGAVSGMSATSDQQAEVAQSLRGTGQYNKPAAAMSADDATDESMNVEPITRPSQQLPDADIPDSGKKTLMMGGMGALTAPADEVDDANKKTLLNFNTKAASGPPQKLSRKAKKKLTRNGKAGDTIPPHQSESPTIRPGASPTDKTVRVNVDAQAVERQFEQEEPAGVGAEVSEPEPKPVIALDPAAAADAGLPGGTPNIGLLAPNPSRDATRDLDRSSWFAPDTDDIWESSLAREAAENSERTNKTIVAVIVAALILGALGLIAFFESTGEETTEPEPNVVAQKPDEPEEPAVDIDEIRTAFDDAIEAKRLVEPIGNSALNHLENLKRYAAEDPRFEEAREQFVDAARVAAKKADEDGDLRRARALAGYASQFAPDDAELAAMTADLQARFTGAAPAVGEQADAGTQADVGHDMGAEEEAPAVEEKDKPVAANNKPRVHKPKDKPKKWDKGGADAAALAREARAAHTSGNLDQARKLYGQALEVDPKSTIALAGLGKVYFDKANYREAVKYQTKAVRYAPTRNDYRISLGQSYYRLGKYGEAIAVWEKVLSRDPNNSTARQYVELAKRKLGH